VFFNCSLFITVIVLAKLIQDFTRSLCCNSVILLRKFPQESNKQHLSEPFFAFVQLKKFQSMQYFVFPKDSTQLKFKVMKMVIPGGRKIHREARRIGSTMGCRSQQWRGRSWHGRFGETIHEAFWKSENILLYFSNTAKEIHNSVVKSGSEIQILDLSYID